MLPHVGPMELFVVFALMLIVIGPRRLPEVARMAGRLLGELRRTTFELRQTLEAELREEERTRWRAEAEEQRKEQGDPGGEITEDEDTLKEAPPELPLVRPAEGTQPAVESEAGLDSGKDALHEPAAQAEAAPEPEAETAPEPEAEDSPTEAAP